MRSSVVSGYIFLRVKTTCCSLPCEVCPDNLEGSLSSIPTSLELRLPE